MKSTRKAQSKRTFLSLPWVFVFVIICGIFIYIDYPSSLGLLGAGISIAGIIGCISSISFNLRAEPAKKAKLLRDPRVSTALGTSRVLAILGYGLLTILNTVTAPNELGHTGFFGVYREASIPGFVLCLFNASVSLVFVYQLSKNKHLGISWLALIPISITTWLAWVLSL